jgi:hypothetical protein
VRFGCLGVAVGSDGGGLGHGHDQFQGNVRAPFGTARAKSGFRPAATAMPTLHDSN